MDELIKKYLCDIIVSIESVETFLGDQRSFEIYQADKMLRRAIEREMEIIGEAVIRISKIDLTISITAKKQIIGLRNRVIHNYDNVDDAIIWGIIVRHLPVLKVEVDKLLKESS